jgi:UDP-2-acetamido-3-amino-2,3-dideoxy-glucuronate N-acetyltransferase
MPGVKCALIGCGGWGKNLARNLHELGALSCIVDPAENAAQMASELGVGHRCDLDDLWASPSMDFDAVVIATPAATHVNVGRSAIAHGKHVYIEKPIALDVNEAEGLASWAEKHSRVLMVGHLLQYHPVYVALRDLAAGGALGSLRHITSTRLNLGMLRHEENVMWSFAPHDISMVLGLVGEEPETVTAIASTFLQRGIPDITTIHVGFPGGVKADIRSSWFSPEKEQKLTVVGDKAMAVFNDTLPWDQKLAVTDYGVEWSGMRPKAVRGEVRFIPVAIGEPLKLEMQHFLECISNSNVPRTNATEAIAVLRVLQAAQQALSAEDI